jgi:hypothetical protein
VIWRLFIVSLKLIVVATYPLWWYEEREQRPPSRPKPRRLAGTISMAEAAENLSKQLRARRIIDRTFTAALITVQCPTCGKAHTIPEERYEMREHGCSRCASNITLTPGPPS